MFLVLASPAAAADPPFTTEVSIDFGYEGSSTDRPLVVLDGSPSASYDYSADTRRHSVAAGATRWLSPVGDDGRTPLELLPYVARASSIAARFSLTGASGDSLGRFTGQESTYEVRYAEDGSVRDASLAAEWFLGRSVSVLGGYEYGNERETAAGTSLESPSGRAQVTTAGIQSTRSIESLGVALRLGEHEVRATGSYGASELVDEEAGAIATGTSVARARFDTDGLARQVRVAARLLFLDRRLVVDASAAYALATSSTNITTYSFGPYQKARAISRLSSIGATWYPTRRLALAAALSYATRDTSAGSPSYDRLSPTREETERTFGASLKWYATERVSASLSAAWVDDDIVVPPQSTTFQRLEETTGRVTLGAALRF